MIIVQEGLVRFVEPLTQQERAVADALLNANRDFIVVERINTDGQYYAQEFAPTLGGSGWSDPASALCPAGAQELMLHDCLT
jgi:hypothetical protein